MQRDIQRSRLTLLMGQKNADERLALFLMTLSAHFKERGYCSVKSNLSMSRAEIANYLGMATDTARRILTRFEQEGILVVERKLVYIKIFPC